MWRRRRISSLDHQADVAETAAAVPPTDFIELLIQHWWREYDLRSQQRCESLLADYDLEAGGQARRVGSGVAAPVQQPPVKFLLPLP